MSGQTPRTSLRRGGVESVAFQSAPRIPATCVPCSCSGRVARAVGPDLQLLGEQRPVDRAPAAQPGLDLLALLRGVAAERVAVGVRSGEDPAQAGEVVRRTHARGRGEPAVGVAHAERRVRRVDARVDDRPADVVAVQVEEHRRGVGLDRVARAPQRGPRGPVAVDRPQERGAVLLRHALQIAERLDREVDEHVVCQPVGRLLVGLVVVGVRGLPRDPADEPDEPDERARQLTAADRPAALLAHRLLQPGDDLRAALGQHGRDRSRVRRPEVLLPPLRQRQHAAQHLLERQLGRDVRLVVGEADRRRIRRRVVGLEDRPGKRGGRRLGVRLEQQVDRVVGLAAVLQPDVGHDRRVLREALELLGAEDPRTQVLELQLHGSSTQGGPDGVKHGRAAVCAVAQSSQAIAGSSTTTGSASSRRVAKKSPGSISPSATRTIRRMP